MLDFISPWIHTTQKCNLKCHYCYVHGDDIMPPRVYGALRELLLKEKAMKRHLRFAGGEPLLVFDIWKPFAEDMLRYKETTVEVLTNLYNVPKDFWKFVEHENVNVSVSIDNGYKQKVLGKEITEKVGRLRNPWIMTTITKENIGRLDIMAGFIGSNGYGWALTTDYFGETTPRWELLSTSLCDIVKILKEFNYDFTRISFNNFSVKSGFSGCRAGREMFAVGCNGDIYKCQTQIGVSDPIGDVFNGYKEDKICKKKECKDCLVNGLCKGWCQLHFKTPNVMCNVIKIFANEVIKEVQNAK